MRFRKGYAAVPLCGPARASMLSGMYPHNHHCLTNGTHRQFVDQGLDQDTVATRMKAAGYDTGYFGKYMNGMHGEDRNRIYRAPGWDRWVNRLVGQDFCVDGVVRTVKGRVDQYSADKCRGFIEDRPGRPWFAVFAPRNPHNDFNLEYNPTRAHAHDFDGVRWDPPAFNEQNMADKPSFWHAVRPKSRESMRAAWEGKLEELQTPTTTSRRFSTLSPPPTSSPGPTSSSSPTTASCWASIGCSRRERRTRSRRASRSSSAAPGCRPARAALWSPRWT